MARPAKWQTPTTAIRVPAHLSDTLLDIARSMEAVPPARQSDTEMAEYLSFVQNSVTPKLFTVQGSKEQRYIVKSDPLSFEEWKELKQVSDRVEREIFNGLSESEQLYLLSRLVQEVFPEHLE
jgi:hypothetical protein